MSLKVIRVVGTVALVEAMADVNHKAFVWDAPPRPGSTSEWYPTNREIESYLRWTVNDIFIEKGGRALVPLSSLTLAPDITDCGEFSL